MSGAGKTTLTKLLLRLADIQEGRITVDGQSIADVTQQSLRRQIAYVPQEALLFHRTIAENIAYGKPDATMDEIREAARAGQRAWSSSSGCPRASTPSPASAASSCRAGSASASPSRAPCWPTAPILVLDEATSALDSESEAAGAGGARHARCSGRTAIVVAHRLSTVASLDRIVVLSDGRVVEDGPHAQLVERNGDYAKLWSMQTGAYLE